MYIYRQEHFIKFKKSTKIYSHSFRSRGQPCSLRGCIWAWIVVAGRSRFTHACKNLPVRKKRNRMKCHDKNGSFYHSAWYWVIECECESECPVVSKFWTLLDFILPWKRFRLIEKMQNTFTQNDEFQRFAKKRLSTSFAWKVEHRSFILFL